MLVVFWGGCLGFCVVLSCSYVSVSRVIGGVLHQSRDWLWRLSPKYVKRDVKPHSFVSTQLKSRLVEFVKTSLISSVCHHQPTPVELQDFRHWAISPRGVSVYCQSSLYCLIIKACKKLAAYRQFGYW